VNSDSDERLGGSYSPTVLCAQVMGRECLCAAGCDVFCLLSCQIHTRDEAIYKTSRVSQEPGEEGALTQPRVEVLQHLWKPLRIKKGSRKTFPIPSRPVTHAAHPAGWLGSGRTPPASPRHAHAHGPARPAAAARACGIILFPSQLLNRDGIKSSI
jgi:hypothetical protein